MRVMSTSPTTMTKGKRKADIIELKELLAQNEDFLRVAVQALVQGALEAEMTQAIGAEKGERTETRLTHSNG
jgi:transposase-like protein